MRYSVILVVGLMISCVACESSEAKFRSDVDFMCNEAIQDESLTTANPEVRLQKLAVVISEKLETTEARDLFDSMGSMAPAQRARALEDAAERAGVKECKLAGVWRDAS